MPKTVERLLEKPSINIKIFFFSNMCECLTKYYLILRSVEYDNNKYFPYNIVRIYTSNDTTINMYKIPT